MADRVRQRGSESDALGELAYVFDEVDAESHAEQRRVRRVAQLIEQESATLTGVLVSLAEQRTRVAFVLNDGWECTGWISAVGTDVVVVFGDDERRRVIRTAVVASVTPERSVRTTSTSGDRSAPLDATFEDVVRDLQAMETPLTVLAATGTSASGYLNWVGTDVAFLTANGPATSTSVGGSYVSLSALRVVVTR
jgi:hypothetical protein